MKYTVALWELKDAVTQISDFTKVMKCFTRKINNDTLMLGDYKSNVFRKKFLIFSTLCVCVCGVSVTDSCD